MARGYKPDRTVSTIPLNELRPSGTAVMARDPNTNGTAENRRALDELTSAYQQLELENRRLRLERERLKKMIGAGAGPAGAKPNPNAGQQVSANSGASAGRPSGDALVPISTPVLPTPGKLVDYIDKRGQDHLALVLDQRAGALRIKVFYRAVPNVVVEVPEQSEKRKTECWRRRA